ncbi:MAG TPA: hypothetical protein VGV12_01550 [Gemmatimonadales bacterium]|nr:hypothetical protein [Gemmatimonadales bacterium]
MRTKTGTAIQIVAVILAGIFPWRMAGAQNGGADALEKQLGSTYKTVKMGKDSRGVAVLEPGTVLVVKKGGILSFPSGDSNIPATNVKDGVVHTPGGLFMKATKKDTKYLTVGEKVYTSKIEINRKDSKVGLAIVECDACNGATDPSFRKAQVVFQFPKDYLDGADGGQVSDLINQTLELETGDSGQQQQGQDVQEQQAPQQEPAPAQPTPTIQLGQSADQVTAILGQPEKIVDLGTKRIYVYKDLKVTFVNGTVTDVQ